MGSVRGTIGKEVVERLIGAYAGGMKGSGGMSKNEMDKRLRVGEALEQVVRRTGGALGGYSDIIIPPLIMLFRSVHVPTILRSSALSLLALCANVAPDAILPWSGELTSAIVDLLQLESVPMSPKPSDPAAQIPPSPSSSKHFDTSGSTKKNLSNGKASASAQRHVYEDSVVPLSKNAKHPSFRRAALHFLALFICARLSRAYDATMADRAQLHGGLGVTLNSISMLGDSGIRLGHMRMADAVASPGSAQNQIGGEMGVGFERLGTVLRYVRMTDEDGMVRIQAGECVDLLEALGKKHLGI